MPRGVPDHAIACSFWGSPWSTAEPAEKNNDPGHIQSLYRLVYYSDLLSIERITHSPGPERSVNLERSRSAIRGIQINRGFKAVIPV